MRLLLDTNVMLAIVEGQTSRLGSAMTDVLSAPDAELNVSVASIWEVAIKSGLGKLQIRIEPARLARFLESEAISVLPIEARHVVASYEPAPLTRDPFDRLLLSVCRAERLTLATLDRALADHPFALGGSALRPEAT